MSPQDFTKESIRGWWAENPMTYGQEHGEAKFRASGQKEGYELGTREFFKQADDVFIRWNQSLHAPAAPFGKIFNYEKYREKNVLEVGCGLGFMTMNWGRQGAKIHGTDLNPVAVHQTRHRLNLFGIPGTVLQSDGELLPWSDSSFSFAYSWGVLHHTPGIQAAIHDLYRVLEPGGGLGLMLYNRASLRQLYLTEYLEGFLHMEDAFLSPLELNSRYGDGARKEGNPHTWPVTQEEIVKELLAKFTNIKIRLLGTEISNVLDLLVPGLGKYLMPTVLKKALARRWGWSIWVTAEKPI